jgi:hypothetical protein
MVGAWVPFPWLWPRLHVDMMHILLRRSIHGVRPIYSRLAPDSACALPLGSSVLFSAPFRIMLVKKVSE